MSLRYPNDCLAYHQARTFSVAKSLADRPTAEIAKQMKLFSGFGTKIKPEEAAIKFYGLNHVVGEISKRRSPFERMSPFEQEIVEMYYREATHIGLRSFYYLLLITVREARHLHNAGKMHKQFSPEFGEDVMSYIGSVPDSPGQATSMFTSSPPPGNLGAYVGALQAVFYNGSWGSAYGGKAWGKIADCLAAFVNGTTSLEQMTDTVFTLAHNCGPIYNKGVFFHNYSSYFLHLLDVQASGQIPNGSLYKEVNNANYMFGSHVPTGSFAELMKKAGKEFPEFDSPVDWFKVTALGAKQTYKTWMQEQKTKGIASPYEAQVQHSSKPCLKIIAAPKTFMGTPVKPVVMMAPGLFYPKLERDIPATAKAA